MSRDSRDVMTAWTIGMLSLIAAALLATGCCGAPYPTEAGEDFTEVEMALVDHTARFAAQLGVNVRGVVTSEMHPSFVQAKVNATAWYESGVAYYYRPAVAEHVRLVPTPGCETATNIAAHEVAHAIFRAHDINHWCCTRNMGATPTYPSPVQGEPTCEGIARQCLR